MAESGLRDYVISPTAGKWSYAEGQAGSATQNEVDTNDPNLTLPLPRYNAMLGVHRNTLNM